MADGSSRHTHARREPGVQALVLLDLSTDVIRKVLAYLGPDDDLATALTCRKMRNLRARARRRRSRRQSARCSRRRSSCTAVRGGAEQRAFLRVRGASWGQHADLAARARLPLDGR